MRFALIFVLACGGKPAPKPPQVSPAEALAKQLADDMTELAAIAHDNPECGALVRSLHPHVERMKRHATEVTAMTSDPVKAGELKAALANKPPARTDQIAKDLGATYLACPDKDVKYQIEKAIAEMPTYE